MDTNEYTLLISIVSLFAGYLLSVWRNRLQPWITLLSFTESQKLTDKVSVNEKVVEASRESWFMDALPGKNTELEHLYDAVSSATQWLETNEDTLNVIDKGVKQLELATTEDDIKKILRDLLNDNISALIELAVVRKLLIPEYNPKDKQVLSYALNKKVKDGCFAIAFSGAYYMFGSNFNINGHRVSELRPFVELLVRLDKPNFLKLFKKLEIIFKQQYEIHQLIKAEAKNIVKENMRWSSRISVSNFGATPFLIFPNEAKLVVRGKQIKEFSLDCKILVQSKTNNEDIVGWEETVGVVILEPASSEIYSIVTNEAQKDIKSGKLLRQVFENNEAEAYVEINLLGRELPWKLKVKSTALPFSGKSKFQ